MQTVTIFVLVNTILVCATDFSEYDRHQVHEQVKKPIIPILKQNYEQHREGYQYSYETGNGIQAQESGYFKNKGDEKKQILVQQGTVTYHDEHGNPITLSYIADEHGFQPQGAHLPTSPPVPEEIQKSIQFAGQQQDYGGQEEVEEYGAEYQH